MSYNELKQRGTADFPIELYHIEKSHPQYEMASHWHSELEIIRILDGTINIKLDNNEYIAKQNDIVFVNPETVHCAFPENGCIYECIVLNLSMLCVGDNSSRFFIDSILNREYIINEFNRNAMHGFTEAVNNLFETLKNPSSGYKFLVISALYRLFGIIVDNHMYHPTSAAAAVYKNVPKLKNVLSFIRDNYDKQITLADMAGHIDMSPKYFCYFFRDMTRKTPVEYLNSYRIEKASRKLLNSDMSVTDIAYSCGFNDLSYFIKTFKATKGTTPAKFRKS